MPRATSFVIALLPLGLIALHAARLSLALPPPHPKRPVARLATSRLGQILVEGNGDRTEPEEKGLGLLVYTGAAG